MSQDDRITGSREDRHRLLLDRAVRDEATATADGQALRRLTHGVVIRETAAHVDDRGALCEIFDARWDWHPDPIVCANMFSIRPGVTKGWGLHRDFEDRYFLVRGTMKLVLFDTRPESPTCGEICEIFLSEQRRMIVNIPTFVWHADENVGDEDVIVVNFPTAPYRHDRPDKYRLPLDTDLIPYRFKNARGW